MAISITDLGNDLIFEIFKFEKLSNFKNFTIQKIYIYNWKNYQIFWVFK